MKSPSHVNTTKTNLDVDSQFEESHELSAKEGLMALSWHKQSCITSFDQHYPLLSLLGFCKSTYVSHTLYD